MSSNGNGSVIGKRWMSMLRLGLARLGDRWRDSRIVYCCADGKNWNTVNLACKAIHGTDRLPWPDENCVVASEGWPFRDSLTLVARCGMSDKVTILSIDHDGMAPHAEVRFGGETTFIWRTLDPPLTLKGYSNSPEWRKTVSGMWKAGLRDGMQEDAWLHQLQQFGKIIGGGLPKEPIRNLWMASGADLLLSSFWLIYALANLATACGYRVTARMRNGYGKPSLKKHTAGREWLILVPFDRIYREVKIEDGEIRSRRPHQKRGHYRYLWKQAGLNRLALPAEIYRRMSLAFKHNVRRVYVNPCWTGPRKWGGDDGDYEVHQGPEMV